MKTLSFQVDYSFCPEGHNEWVFVPSSTLYGDIFWCDKCDCFYLPSVKKISKERLNVGFLSDRAQEIIELARFIKWKNSLSVKDMPRNAHVDN